MAKGKKRSRKVVHYAMAVRAMNAYYDELMAFPGVTGVSVGARIKNDVATKEMVIRLTVSSKSQKKYLRANADDLGLKKEYGGIGVDIVVWRFRTSSSAMNGARVRSVGGKGVVGMAVRATVAEDDIRNIWVTAAHVAGSQANIDQVDQVNVTRSGRVIGTISKDHYFRNSVADMAYIVPAQPFGSFLIRPQRVHRLVADDRDKDIQVLIEGDTINCKIIDLKYHGDIEADPGEIDESIEDHFVVQNNGKLKRGDSGVLATLDGKWVGLLRAVDKSGEAAVFCKINRARTLADSRDRGF